MSVDAIPGALTSIMQLQQQLTDPNAPSSSALASPTDPFNILLAAATGPSPAGSVGATPVGTNPSEPATTLALPGASLSGSTSPSAVDPQLASLASLSSSTLSGAASATATDTPTSSSGAAVVAEASQYLGVPYVWGGSTPSGFDCSGLTQYVFGQLGVELPRTAAAQEQVGTPVADLAQAEPGDLLFFEPGENGAPAGEAGHVAIYLGNGQMIAAPETDQNVQIQQVPTQPLAIRQVTVPTTTDPTTTDATNPAASRTADLTTADPTTGVEMGNVSVPAEYAGVIAQASASSGTPAPLLAAVLSTESGFDPAAVSPAGAEGIAQFMPSTATANGVNPFDPTSAIIGAASLLAQYHAAFGSWSDAVAAYNAGGGAVEQAGGVPDNGKTPAYVTQVLSAAGMEPVS